MKRQNVATIKNANTKKQKQEIVSELPSVDYFEVFLEKVRALEVRNELARKIENDPIFHNQTFLSEKVKQKLLEFNKVDSQLAAGICHAISLMRDTCALSHLKEDKTLFLTGLKLIICHNPPEDDFSDLILSFYKVARYIQIDAFGKLNCNDLHIIESIKRRGTPKIYNTITLPVLLTADELKRLFHVLTTDPAYWKNSNATFLLTTNQHTTTGEYEHDEKVFSYLDSNARKEKVIVPEDDEPSTPANIDELYDEVKQALCVGNYKNFDENNPNSYLPIYFSTFSHRPNQNNRTNLLKKIILISDKQYIMHREDSAGMTSLFLAAQANDVDAINYLLWLKVNPNIKFKQNGFTAFITAVCLNNYNAACALLKFNRRDTNDVNMTEIDIHIPDNVGWTALHYAVFNGPTHHKLVELILSHNGNPMLHDPVFGVTPIKLALNNNMIETLRLLSPLFAACIENNEQEVTRLLQRGVKPSFMVYEWKSLLYACIECNVSTPILNLLVQYGADINFVHHLTSESILVHAIKHKRYDFFDTHNNTGKPALYIAVQSGAVEVVQDLLTQGANPNATYSGDKPIIQYAVKHNLTEIVKLLMSTKKIDINLLYQKNDEYLPTSLLSCAVKEGHVDMVRLLISLGADINAAPEHRAINRAPLYYAVINEDVELCKLLLQHGADTSLQFETEYNDEKTVLEIAEEQGFAEIAWLIKFHQQETLAQQINVILPTYTRHTDRSSLYVDPVRELKKKLIKITAQQDLTADDKQQQVRIELENAYQDNNLPQQASEQISWYLEHTGKVDLLMQQMMEQDRIAAITGLNKGQLAN